MKDEVSSYAYWCVSDVFEESGPGTSPYTGKYGLMNLHGIKKPVYHAFNFRSMLYKEEIDCEQKSSIVTINGKQDLRILSWNHNEPTKVDYGGKDYVLENKQVHQEMKIEGLNGVFQVKVYMVDRHHGNAMTVWQERGEKKYLKREDVVALKNVSEPFILKDERVEVNGSYSLKLNMTPCSMFLIDILEVK